MLRHSRACRGEEVIQGRRPWPVVSMEGHRDGQGNIHRELQCSLLCSNNSLLQ